MNFEPGHKACIEVSVIVNEEWRPGCHGSEPALQPDLVPPAVPTSPPRPGRRPGAASRLSRVAGRGPPSQPGPGSGHGRPTGGHFGKPILFGRLSASHDPASGMLARLGPGALRHTLARRPGAVRRAAGGNLTWNLNSVRVKLTGAAAAVPVAVGPLRRRSPTLSRPGRVHLCNSK